ncbi:16S rRNA processing protein RimM [hydrothermal vent metagenome]|uniref:16S rRNA processing protein RimM n=1 Tax=hydrothermal vent metagenome TaxID=652676 RepID=A0A1W1CSS6_9ZZZZ
MSKDEALIAQIGRTIGLWGDLKFHLHTDFPEQFIIGNTYKSTRGDLTIADINEKRGIIRFIGHESIDSAKKLTNVKLFSDEIQTRKNCNLSEGQHFWFDMMHCFIEEDETILGKITDIQRMGDTDYLFIQTDATLIEEGFAKTFLVPYIERFVLSVNLEKKTVYTKDSKDILEAS